MQRVSLDNLTPVSEYWPDWIRELGQNHKSTWIADSKGGEPNCRREHENGTRR